jgi:hypothetical protein
MLAMGGIGLIGLGVATVIGSVLRWRSVRRARRGESVPAWIDLDEHPQYNGWPYGYLPHFPTASEIESADEDLQLTRRTKALRAELRRMKARGIRGGPVERD